MPLPAEEASSPCDPMALAAVHVSNIITSCLEICAGHGLDDEKTLGLAIASSLSLYIDRHGPDEALGFIGDTIKYFEQSLIHLADRVPYDVDRGPGVVARLDYAPFRTRRGTVNMATQCVVRSTSGTLFLLDVSPGHASIQPMSCDEAEAWARKHGSPDEVDEIISRLVAT